MKNQRGLLHLSKLALDRVDQPPELKYGAASASEDGVERPPVTTQRLQHKLADTVVLDPVWCALLEVEQVCEPLLANQLEEGKVPRNGPTVRPHRWREKQRAMDVLRSLGCEMQRQHGARRQDSDQDEITPLLEQIMGLFDGAVPI